MAVSINLSREGIMSIRNLQSLFQPKSVAVIGASEKPHSVGATVLRNLIEARFQGEIFPVNPKYDRLEGYEVYRDAAHLPTVPDLAVICTPPDTIPAIIRQLGERGTKAAVVLTAGLGNVRDPHGVTIKQAMLDAARPHLLRILGPNCVGLLVPDIGLNASFAHTGALPGKITFVSQSGALVTGVLDWAKTRGIGFSKFISLGDSADIDFGDLLDYLASDVDTHSILLYIEDVREARKFMSAARAAARSKPVIVVKSGRVAEGAKAASSHTGALAGSDDVYDAAIRRAGMLRVLGTEDLFDAVETLARAKPLFGERLTIVTNGGGPGVLATDALIAEGGKLAELSADTMHKLNEILPPTWSHGNPVDIIGDATGERYRQAMEVLLKDPKSDAILFIHAPTAIVPSADIAKTVAPLAKDAARNIISCWLGGDSVAQARRLFSESGIPTFDTPEEAVGGFMQMVQYRRNQDLLMQVPPSACAAAPAGPAFVPDREAARAVVRRALELNRPELSEPDAKRILAAYGIPVVRTEIADRVEAAVMLAQQIGFPVALKVLSPEVSHKTEVGGVVLDLESPEAVRSAAIAMQKRLHEIRPDATLHGFSVQSMERRPRAHELIVGVSTDPVFGPVILFGQGGISVEVTADHALALPPLNMVLARDVISRTRISKLLAGYRNRPPADIDGICRTLINLSTMIADIPEIIELDINPLLTDENGVIALDARMRVTPAEVEGAARFAIRPYPDALEETVSWQGSDLLIRPIKPEDAPQHLAFFNALDPEDVRYRIFTRLRELQPSQLARLTQIDYDREMAFIAIRQREDGTSETVGVARAISDPDNITAEFAVIVRSDVKGQGLGRILMQKLIGYCRSRGTQELVGEALPNNKRVLNMSTALGFQLSRAPHDETMLMRLRLQ
jgi:acetyltransferase